MDNNQHNIMSEIYEMIESLEYEKAANHLNELLRLNPNNIEAIDTFSEVLVNLGETEEAILVK